MKLRNIAIPLNINIIMIKEVVNSKKGQLLKMHCLNFFMHFPISKSQAWSYINTRIYDNSYLNGRTLTGGCVITFYHKVKNRNQFNNII